jgi:hypothetical protein
LDDSQINVCISSSFATRSFDLTDDETYKGRNKHNSLLANMVISDLFKCLK